MEHPFAAHLKSGYNIVLFDGVCNLCSSGVLFIINRDPTTKHLFASLQSKEAQSFVDTRILHTGSFVLIEPEGIYTESTAILRIIKQLSGPGKLLYAFIILPKRIRDSIYRLIARNRYRFFGKKEACMISSPELKSRFID